MRSVVMLRSCSDRRDTRLSREPASSLVRPTRLSGVEERGDEHRQPQRARLERGSGTLLVAAVAVIAMVLVWVVAVVAAYVSARHTAETAADLAAIDGARAIEANGDACAAAEKTATANGGVLVACEIVHDHFEYVVTVEVTAEAGISLPGVPPCLRARSQAGRINE